MTNLNGINCHLGVVALTISQFCTITTRLIVGASLEITTCKTFLLGVRNGDTIEGIRNLSTTYRETNLITVAQMVCIREQVTVACVAIGNPNTGNIAVAARIAFHSKN